MKLTEALDIVKALLAYRKEVVFEADGADDRVYPNDKDWEAIEELYIACLNEF